MSDRRSEDDDRRLDAVLEGWAERQRLDASEADEVLRAVLREPRTVLQEHAEVLPASWWSDLSTQISAAVVLASSRPGTFPEQTPHHTAAA
jgi:hypothetical protein